MTSPLLAPNRTRRWMCPSIPANSTAEPGRCVSFFRGPFSDSGVSQYLPVQPNVRYRLSAFVKSEDIVSASGPRIVVQDYYGNQVLASTEDLLSTSGWRELLVDFTTGPQMRLIAIRVMRVPGNPLIKGTFWLDDVKLALAQTAAADDEASP